MSSFGPKDTHVDTTTMKLPSDRTFDQKFNRREIFSDRGAGIENPVSEANFLEAVQNKSQRQGPVKIHEQFFQNDLQYFEADNMKRL